MACGSALAGCTTPAIANSGRDAAPEGAPCVGSLDGVANTWAFPCPATSSDAADAGCAAQSAPNPLAILRSSCGGLQVLGYSWGTHGQSCFYPADGGVLVGATAQDDQPSFCGQTSYTISAGSVREVLILTGATSTTWSVSGETCDMLLQSETQCSGNASSTSSTSSASSTSSD